MANALKLVGYPIESVKDVFGRLGVKDPEIIKWCEDSNAIWIHADDTARREHARLIKAAEISTVWIPRPKSGLSAKAQLGRLAHKLQAIQLKVRSSKRSVHLKLSASGTRDEPKVSLRDVTADQNRMG